MELGIFKRLRTDSFARLNEDSSHGYQAITT